MPRKKKVEESPQIESERKPVEMVEQEIRELIKTFYQIQKLRVAVELRTKLTKFSLCPNGHLIPLREGSRERCPICDAPVKIVSKEPSPILLNILDVLKNLERGDILKRLNESVKDHILWRSYLSKIKGVGPVMAAYLISVLNPVKFDTVSKMWKYCGLHVVDGKAPRRVAGQKTDWNPFARAMMWRLGESFRMVGGFYRMMYEKFFEDCTRNHKDWTKAHCIAHARRVTVKLFLSHYYYLGRKMLGLNAREPYSCVVKPHECIPPIFDEYEKDEERVIYQLYLKDTWSWETFKKWIDAYKKWLKAREEYEK
jgi:hypothetical protein